MWIHERRAGAYSVADTGIGIPSEDLSEFSNASIEWIKRARAAPAAQGLACRS